MRTISLRSAQLVESLEANILDLTEVLAAAEDQASTNSNSNNEEHASIIQALESKIVGLESTIELTTETMQDAEENFTYQAENWSKEIERLKNSNDNNNDNENAKIVANLKNEVKTLAYSLKASERNTQNAAVVVVTKQKQIEAAQQRVACLEKENGQFLNQVRRLSKWEAEARAKVEEKEIDLDLGDEEIKKAALSKYMASQL